MKIRNGFVSNSSTSSFIVASFKISPEPYFKTIKKLLPDEDISKLFDDDGEPDIFEIDYLLSEKNIQIFVNDENKVTDIGFIIYQSPTSDPGIDEGEINLETIIDGVSKLGFGEKTIKDINIKYGEVMT